MRITSYQEAKILLSALFFTYQLFANPGQVTTEVERINTLRVSLVKAVQGPVDSNTFKAICAPVGAEAKRVAQKNGWNFRQVSKKYRNPTHKPNSFEKKILKMFASDPNLMGHWQRHGGENHYFRRIRVDGKCLRCHGKKDTRPDFIKTKYPKDRAFDFKEGDLRGLYHVSFPIKPAQ